MNSRETMYIVLLVDGSNLAATLNLLLTKLNTRHFRIEVKSSMQQMIGLRHGAYRPTLVIDLIKNRDIENFDKWYAECVRASAINGRLIQVYEEERK